MAYPDGVGDLLIDANYNMRRLLKPYVINQLPSERAGSDLAARWASAQSVVNMRIIDSHAVVLVILVRVR